MKTAGEILLHPIRMRIIQQMADQSERTVAEIGERMQDIPRTTLYRHIHTLVEQEYLIVTREIQIRGTYERAYQLNFKKIRESGEESEMEENVRFFLFHLLASFDQYFKEEKNPRRDRLFLTTNTLLLTDEEYDECVDEMFTVMKRYLGYDFQEGRKERILSLLSSPGGRKGK